MPSYESDLFTPPAPVIYVTLRHPTTGTSLSEIPMLMDTGADITLLSREYIEQLGIEPVEDIVYELQGFDGGITVANVV